MYTRTPNDAPKRVEGWGNTGDPTDSVWIRSFAYLRYGIEALMAISTTRSTAVGVSGDQGWGLMGEVAAGGSSNKTKPGSNTAHTHTHTHARK